MGHYNFAFVLGLSSLMAACVQTPDPVDPPVVEAMGLERTAVTPKQASDPYYVTAAAAVAARDGTLGQAKNVILFVGDGMGISTVTAARIYAGQKRDMDGESYRLAMDSMPYSALSKTYSHDYQVSDSAATATAMVSGVKTRSGALGVTSDVAVGNCASQIDRGTDSLFELAERAGLATGVISTAKLTHATPAATYAESASRGWEDDSSLGTNSDCKDIATQFVEWEAGDGFEIALGGGRQHFRPAGVADPESENEPGRRTDGRDLTAEWAAKSDAHVYVDDAAGFAAADIAGGAKVLGLFEASHMQFELDRPGDAAGEPSIEDMTRAAITRLSQNENGFVLMVEGGRIDHGHHAGNAIRALEDADAMDRAVAAALEMTSADDTLIIVTADHSHTLTIAGYPVRGNPILGKSSPAPGVVARAEDGKPYTTLGYANGPGSCRLEEDAVVCDRQDLSDVDTEAKDFRQPALVPTGSETHAGEDVAVFASGPGADMVRGVMEQNEIFHVMGAASGLVE